MKNAIHTLLVLAATATAAGAADFPALAEKAAKYQSGGDVVPLREFERALVATIDRPADRAQAEAALIRMLAPDATYEAKRFACERLSEFGSDAAVPAIAALLGADETAGIACAALGGTASPKAGEALRHALASAKGGARIQIVSALGLRGDTGSVPLLAGLARDPDAGLARAATAALGGIPAGPARDALAALRKDARPELADDVAAASLNAAARLVAGGDRAAAASICNDVLGSAKSPYIRRGAYSALLRTDEDGGMARIRAALAASPRDALLVPVAIAQVPTLKAADASATFAALMPGLGAAEQVWMIEALAVRADPGARDAVRARVSAADAGVRRAAIAAVGRLEDASAVPLLAASLAAATAAEDRSALESALAGLRGGDATDNALVAAMQQAKAEAKPGLVGILARRGARSALPALLAETEAEDVAVARAAYQAIAKLGGPGDVPALIGRLVKVKDGTLRGDAETAAARALARMPDAAQRSKAVMAALAANPGADARGALLRLLSVAGDAAALGSLRAAMTDGEASIRDAAVRGLAGWPDASAWEPVLAVLQKPESDAHRALAFQGLVRMAATQNRAPDAALLARYRQLMEGVRTDDDRKLILGALAGVAHPEALPLVLPLLDQPAVRPEAILALKAIIPAVKPSHPKEAVEAWKKMKAAEGQP